MFLYHKIYQVEGGGTYLRWNFLFIFLFSDRFIFEGSLMPDGGH